MGELALEVVACVERGVILRLPLTRPNWLEPDVNTNGSNAATLRPRGMASIREASSVGTYIFPTSLANGCFFRSEPLLPSATPWSFLAKLSARYRPSFDLRDVLKTAATGQLNYPGEFPPNPLPTFEAQMIQCSLREAYGTNDRSQAIDL